MTQVTAHVTILYYDILEGLFYRRYVYIQRLIGIESGTVSVQININWSSLEIIREIKANTGPEAGKDLSYIDFRRLLQT